MYVFMFERVLCRIMCISKRTWSLLSKNAGTERYAVLPVYAGELRSARTMSYHLLLIIKGHTLAFAAGHQC